MNTATSEIRPDLELQYDPTARIQEGLAQAQRGEFVPDEEMQRFFADCAESISAEPGGC